MEENPILDREAISEVVFNLVNVTGMMLLSCITLLLQGSLLTLCFLNYMGVSSKTMKVTVGTKHLYKHFKIKLITQIKEKTDLKICLLP